MDARLHLPTSPSSFGDRLLSLVRTAKRVRIIVAFVSRSGLNRLIHGVVREDGALDFALILSDMNLFNDAAVLRHAKEVFGPERLRVAVSTENDHGARPSPLHGKGFMTEDATGAAVLIVGSSNLTGGGLGGNREWNLELALNSTDPTYQAAVAEFEREWSQAERLTDAFIAEYESERQRRQLVADGPPPRHQTYSEVAEQSPFRATSGGSQPAAPEPREWQLEALQGVLARLRSGDSRALVVAPTGFGKTWLAAFLVRDQSPRRFLFVVHRESILTEAMTAFSAVLGDTYRLSKLGGSAGSAALADLRSESRESLGVFAMVQTLSGTQILNQLTQNSFDIIIMDEFHHAQAPSYRSVLGHFRPEFVLGMTATPERADGRDILQLCHGVVAYEMRVFEGIDREILSPFQYLAIHDPTDYQALRWTGTGYDEAELEAALSRDSRGDLVAANLSRYLPAFGKIKAIAFCANVGHARFMASALTQRGMPAQALWGETPEQERVLLLQRLEDETDSLQILCAVDVLSEGIDVPSLTHVLFLRPTESSTVFLQQLGRGLRRHSAKDFLLVLDFIGNYRRNYIAARVLSGDFSGSATPRSASEVSFQLPHLCTADVDAEVVDVWNQELERSLRGLSLNDRFALVLQDFQQELDQESEAFPSLTAFALASPDVDVPSYIGAGKVFPNWLRALQQQGELDEAARGWLDGPGERFLQHVESELNPNKTYKMTVLQILLLWGDRTEWEVHAIAWAFRKRYLSDPDLRADWPELDRGFQAGRSTGVTDARAIDHVKKNPLNFLSNTEAKPFALADSVFALKPEYHTVWHDAYFRQHVRDRVEYANLVYWRRHQRRAVATPAGTGAH